MWHAVGVVDVVWCCCCCMVLSIVLSSSIFARILAIIVMWLVALMFDVDGRCLMFGV